MASMDVSVVLRLSDQLSGPARQAANALKDLVKTGQQLKRLVAAPPGSS
jgi:hypothetical protein